MKPVFFDSSIPEINVKKQYNFPEFIMMENAATSLENKVIELLGDRPLPKILILCGNGNNGGDGLALARKLFGNISLDVFLIKEPKTTEAKVQYTMAKSMSVPFINTDQINWKSYSLIVDCVFGTGFHGDLSPEVEELFINANSSKALKLACDIPSGLAKDGTAAKNSFCADCTVTMGALKTALFSDAAKNLCGNITVADLGIHRSIFEKHSTPDAFLIEKEDINLPLRKNKSSHKGTYGHTVVYAGEKSGAAILSATASLKFGSGLTSLYKTPESNLEQFKISPCLMICDTQSLPKKTTCVVIGCGLGNPSQELISNFINWFTTTKNPACVIDADLFNYKELPQLLSKINDVENARIVLTPHPKELQNLANSLKIDNRTDYTIQEVAENRIELGKKICSAFKSITLVLKSANTFIITNEKAYICNSGSQAMAKGGSGDVLAGMVGSLLAQGYTSEAAAITATFAHGYASKKSNLGEEDFSITPETLIDNL